MDTSKTMVTMVEQCQISPPSGAITNTYLPLTFFDMGWLMVPPVRRLLFYDSPTSKTDFIQTFVPNLKTSLSIALKHYFPFAGNSVIPSTGALSSTVTPPQIRYLNGDSVTFTVAEYTSKDFNNLIGNHLKDVIELFPFVPPIPTSSTDGDCVVTPLFAVQVTLFPNRGTAVGFAISHVAADGKSMCNFIQKWGSIAKQLYESNNDDSSIDQTSTLFPDPFYDRSVIKDPEGIASILWNDYLSYKSMLLENPKHQPQPQTDVHATVVMHQADIQELKKMVLTKLPTLAHVSSFTVVSAYLWICMAKARVAIGQDVHDPNEEEYFVFMMDCRARLDPPVSNAYFGNCLQGVVATARCMELLGEEGMFVAAQGIGEAIHAKIHNKEGGVLKDAANWYSGLGMIMKHKVFGVAGSPKFEYYDTDFGWGKPKKVEVVSQKSSLNSQGDVEIGVCFPKNLVEAFTEIFSQGLAS